MKFVKNSKTALSICVLTTLFVSGCNNTQKLTSEAPTQSITVSVTENLTESMLSTEAPLTTESHKGASSELVTDVSSEIASELVTDVSSEIASEYIGSWYGEAPCDRCLIEINSSDLNTFDIVIQWGSGYNYSSYWEMTAAYDNTTHKLEYKDGKHYTRTFEDSVNYTDDIEYSDGSGELYLENSKLAWVSSKDDDNMDGSAHFIKYDETAGTEETSSDLDTLNLIEDVNFAGEYEYGDVNQGVAHMTIVRKYDNYEVGIYLPVIEGQEEYFVNFTIPFSTTNTAEYSDAIRTRRVSDENGGSVDEIEYTDGTGKITLKEDENGNKVIEWYDETVDFTDTFVPVK